MKRKKQEPTAVGEPPVEESNIEEGSEEAVELDPVAVLAAVVHHYGAGEFRVTKAYLSEGIGSRLKLDVEDDGDGYTLRTQIVAPEPSQATEA